MVVTEITDLDKRRRKVFLDEDFAFVLYKGEIRHYQIEENQELSEESYKEIMEEILTKRAKIRALYLLKSTDKTEQELRKKLLEGFYPSQVIDRAIEYVKSYHYINDEVYARRYIETYGNKKSTKKLVYDLEQKGIDHHLIESLLEESPIEEERQIRKWLEKKKYSAENTDFTQQQKIIASLARKGFSLETIRRILGNFSELE